jgi:curli biogenesis system outer membrane secretion channel CsgG
MSGNHNPVPEFIKRLIQFSFVIVFGCSVVACHPTKLNIVVSPDYTRNTRLRLAVLDFEFKAGQDISSLFYGAGSLKNAGSMVADLLTEEIMSIPGITVVERSKLKTILDEKKLSVSGLLESKELQEISRLVGIDSIVTGSVGDAGALNVLAVFQESNVAFQARCIRVSDGVVLWSGSIVTGTGSHNVTRTMHSAVNEFGEGLRNKLKTTDQTK